MQKCQDIAAEILTKNRSGGGGEGGVARGFLNISGNLHISD